MKKIYFTGFFLVLLSSCIANKNEKMVVTSKWNFIQSEAINCEDDGSNSPTSCVFNYKGKRYLRKESYTLDPDGKVDSIYSYHVPLGVNIYTIEEYRRYMMSLDALGFEEMKKIQIKWDNYTHKIADKNKTIDHTLIEDNKVIVINGDELTIYKLTEKYNFNTVKS